MTTPIAVPTASTPRLTALVVERRSPDLFFAVSVLSLGGFQITVADNFVEARALLASRSPALLWTEIRLEEYNGLHLVLCGKAANPAMSVVVVSEFADNVLQAEAESMGGTFILKPTARDECLAAVLRTCFRSPANSAPVRPPFERRHVQRRGVPVPVASDRRAPLDRRRAHDSTVESSVILP